MSMEPQIEGLTEWRPLARGGLSVVWEARQLCLDRLVAVKVYERDLLEAGQRHYARETAAAGKLSVHSGIVTVHDGGMLPGGRPYLLMDLCPGGSLTTWLEPERKPSAERVRQVGLRIAGALAAAHAAGVVHRDVTPANILIDGAGQSRLADFGLAVDRGAVPEPADALLLNPAWAPPEAFREEPATVAGDVYSLAATLYALLAGRAPRAGGPAVGTGAQRVDLAPVPPIHGVDASLMAVLLGALAVDPAARPDASVFYAQLATLPMAVSGSSDFVRGATAALVSTVGRSSAGIQLSAAASSTGQGSVAARVVTPAPVHGVGGVPVDGSRWRETAPTRALTLAASLVIVIAFGAAWVVRGPGASGDLTSVADAAVPTKLADASSPRTSDADAPALTRTRRADDGAVPVLAGAKDAQPGHPHDPANLVPGAHVAVDQAVARGGSPVQEPEPGTPVVPAPATDDGQPVPAPVVEPGPPAPSQGSGSTDGHGSGHGSTQGGGHGSTQGGGHGSTQGGGHGSTQGGGHGSTQGGGHGSTQGGGHGSTQGGGHGSSQAGGHSNSQGNGHSSSNSQGNGHSSSNSQGNGHSSSNSQGSGHSNSHGNGHSDSKDQDKDKGQGQDKGQDKGQGQDKGEGQDKDKGKG